MSQPKIFTPVKLICGLMFNDRGLYLKARDRLAERFGPTDFESLAFSFELTEYYEPEMGPELKRAFLSFAGLVGPQDLPEIKLGTNELEDTLRREAKRAGRPVNIDPGYLTASALIMATAKDFSHRVPLRQGIYAHLEFLFTKTGIRTLDWTYPDFRQTGYQEFFLAVREIYLRQLKRGGVV